MSTRTSIILALLVAALVVASYLFGFGWAILAFVCLVCLTG